jgi:vitamin B12/bleomycin/antimicrobial peptide transport system ATP-binding/permease protein
VENTQKLTTLRSFFTLTLGWWAGKTRLQAFTLTFLLILSLLINVSVNYGVNQWNRFFFDALGAKNASQAFAASLYFLGLLIAATAVGVAIVLSRETLQVRWREWLTHKLLDKWNVKSNKSEVTSPEYRIADDSRMALEPIVDFAIGLTTSLFSGLVFITVLWNVGGSYTLLGVTIHGFMVFAALFYALIVSGLMILIGKNLPTEMAKRNETEAKFRFELMRVRENSLEKLSRDGLTKTYTSLVTQWLKVVRLNGAITWVTNSSGVFIPVLPLLLCAPKFFEGGFTLGEVTQLAGAFIQTQIAISWLVDNFRALAQCYASVLRITELNETLED